MFILRHACFMNIKDFEVGSTGSTHAEKREGSGFFV
jgi:hypothetical protein